VSDSISRIDGQLAWCGRILPPGSWHDEPDHVDFEHDGLACILHRNSSWCGYVAVPPGHPWHGKGYDWEGGIDPDVHGGITYAGKCQGAICQVAKPGEPDDVWWIGFDCNHHLDVSMYDIAAGRTGVSSYGESYRDLAYVRWQTQKLAAQAKAVQP